MPDFSKMTDDQLIPWINGSNTQLGSENYMKALGVWEDRAAAKSKKQIENWIEVIVSSLNNLRETWKSKVFWLILVSAFVGLGVNLLSTSITHKIFNTRNSFRECYDMCFEILEPFGDKRKEMCYNDCRPNAYVNFEK